MSILYSASKWLWVSTGDMEHNSVYSDNQILILQQVSTAKIKNNLNLHKMNYTLIEQQLLDMLLSKINFLIDTIIDLYQPSRDEKLNKWLDSQDVWKALNISPRTLQYYRNKGIIPYSYIGNKIYYESHSIASLLSNGLIKPKQWTK